MKKLLLSVLVLLAGLNKTVAQDSITKNIPAQVSLFYPLGTSGHKSANQEFAFSLNVLYGVAGKVSGIGISGIGSTTKSDVKGAQFAGVFNNIGGNSAGYTAAGILNRIKGNVNGYTTAGVFNVVEGETKGMQVAGVFNHTKGNLTGVSVAGVFNNVQGDTKGMQVAGVLNRTKVLKGFQIAPVNIVDTISGGVSFGLINIIKKGGYNEWELSLSDSQNIGLSFKHGTKMFYNIYNIGVNFLEDDLWSAGLGFGHIQKITSKLDFQPEAITNIYLPTDFKDVRRTMTYKLKLGLVYSISDRMAISLAPNVYYADKENNKKGGYGYDISPIKSFNDHTNKDTKYEWGMGFSVGLILRSK